MGRGIGDEIEIRESVAPRAEKTALICVDVQSDFLPGGALAVSDGDEVIEELIEIAGSDEVDLVIASRDWHPADHISFKNSNPEGLWPDHCVAGSPGAEIHPKIAGLADLVISKATESERDAYSAFDGTELASELRSRGVRRVIVGGLATDYCVKATVLSALSEGFDVELAPRASRAVSDQEGAVSAMAAAGARLRDDPAA